mmetsp:Transcript_88197/g.239098  ORF Transcript_88197/g.239098 Transcript_88197/m.239098 type:complete len:369 (+) Transcript_88197:814-1920(+)
MDGAVLLDGLLAEALLPRHDARSVGARPPPAGDLAVRGVLQGLRQTPVRPGLGVLRRGHVAGQRGQQDQAPEVELVLPQEVQVPQLDDHRQDADGRDEAVGDHEQTCKYDRVDVALALILSARRHDLEAQRAPKSAQPVIGMSGQVALGPDLHRVNVSQQPECGQGRRRFHGSGRGVGGASLGCGRHVGSTEIHPDAHEDGEPGAEVTERLGVHDDAPTMLVEGARPRRLGQLIPRVEEQEPMEDHPRHQHTESTDVRTLHGLRGGAGGHLNVHVGPSRLVVCPVKIIQELLLPKVPTRHHVHAVGKEEQASRDADGGADQAVRRPVHKVAARHVRGALDVLQRRRGQAQQKPAEQEAAGREKGPQQV